jgi:hypothetical protein
MASQIDIINRALVLLGADRISSLTDGTTESESASEIYPGVIEDLISRYRWRFAHVQIQLSRLADAPDARWDAAYQLPSDLKVLETVTVNDEPIEYDRLEDKVVCNAQSTDQVYAEYVIQNDESKWPGYFISLVVYELASLLSTPVGDREDLAERFEKRSLRQFGLAKNLDAQGVTTKKIKTDRFRKVRRGYLTGSSNG